MSSLSQSNSQRDDFDQARKAAAEVLKQVATGLASAAHPPDVFENHAIARSWLWYQPEARAPHFDSRKSPSSSASIGRLVLVIASTAAGTAYISE